MSEEKQTRDFFREVNSAIEKAFERKAKHLKAKQPSNKNRANKLSFILSEERRLLGDDGDQW